MSPAGSTVPVVVTLPTTTNPVLLTVVLRAPPVVTDKLFSEGKNIPVLVSPVLVITGFEISPLSANASTPDIVGAIRVITVASALIPELSAVPVPKRV